MAKSRPSVQKRINEVRKREKKEARAERRAARSAARKAKADGVVETDPDAVQLDEYGNAIQPEEQPQAD